MPKKISRRQMFQCVQESTIPISDEEDARGSAFLMQKDRKSVVCTARHVFSVTPSLHDLGPKVNPNLDFVLLTAADNLGYDAAKFSYGSHDDVRPGDKVYYGGCPFSASTPHVHVGTVSAIVMDFLGRRSIKIDGTAVRGMSGGPIFIQKHDEASDEYIPTIIGFLASQTFDPVEQFEKALGGLVSQIRGMEAREEVNCGVREFWSGMVRSKAKIERGQFYSDDLDRELRGKDPSGEYKTSIWDDLNRANILTEEGGLNATMLSEEKVRSALREEYQPYLALVMKRLEALHASAETKAEDLDGADLPGMSPDEPTDHLVRVGMSLVNSMSTGVVTGYFIEDALRNLVEFDEHASVGSGVVLSTEFEIGCEYDRLFNEGWRRVSRGVEDKKTLKQLEVQTHEQTVAQVIRMAGRYCSMRLYAKEGKVESDHFPPKSVYPAAKDEHISRLSESAMAALNLRYEDHRAFITTGSGRKAIEFRTRQMWYFRQGEYCTAIEINLEEYRKANLIGAHNKSALAEALFVHVQNRLITEEQRGDLIRKYNLLGSDEAREASATASSSGEAGTSAAAALGGHGLFAVPSVLAVERGSTQPSKRVCDGSVASQYNIPAGLQYQPVIGDGNCLYRAVTYYLSNGEDVSFLRSLVAANLEHNKTQYADFIPLRDGQSIQDYIAEIRNTRTSAGNVEIDILMKLLDRPIVVIGPDGIIRDKEAVNQYPEKEPIFVFYDGGDERGSSKPGHYDALLLRGGYNGRDILSEMLDSTTMTATVSSSGEAGTSAAAALGGHGLFAVPPVASVAPADIAPQPMSDDSDAETGATTAAPAPSTSQ